MFSDDDHLYEIAVREVSSRSMVAALAARAFADADGDERKTVARYIKLRVEQLRLEQEAIRQAEKERLRADDAARVRLDPADLRLLKKTFSFYATEKLKDIYSKRNTSEFRPEAYEAARLLLLERAV